MRATGESNNNISKNFRIIAEFTKLMALVCIYCILRDGDNDTEPRCEHKIDVLIDIMQCTRLVSLIYSMY